MSFKNDFDDARSLSTVNTTTSRLTLPSLCSAEPPEWGELEGEFLGGLSMVHDNKVSVWESTVDRPIDPGLISPVKFRRRLYTPPEIRQRIRAMQRAKQNSLEAERALGGAKFEDESNSRERGGIQSRTKSSSASREIARRIQLERIKASEDKKLGGNHGHSKSSMGAAAAYLNSERDSPEELEQRRMAAMKRKQERGDVIMLRKKPVSPPKSTAGGTGTRINSRAGGGSLVGNMTYEPIQDSSAVTTASIASSTSTVETSIDNVTSIDDVNEPPPFKELTLKERCARNNSVLQEQYKSYFGSSAKNALMMKFKRAAQDLETMPKDNDVPEDLRTPRFMYLREVEKGKLLPLPLPVRKPANPRGVFLAGKGLGDARALPIVLVLDTLPAVETIDLSDNRMTDVSIMPLTLKLRALTTLTHLDLSFNKMDDSSASIMKYISSKECTLRTLKLNGSDVDDYECCNLCDAMIENFSIETLCLSRNLLGSDEHKRTLKPNLVLAGDGIAKMLDKNKKLTSLDLSWNSLRLSGAVAIGRALKKNKMLKSLFLQFNSFGDLGAQAVGYALKYNKCLQELDLSNNSIVPRSACVLANALSHNSTLVFLNISDNILGRVGSQAVVAAIQRTQDLKRVISFSSCDCTREDSSLFDPAKPQGRWSLNLDEPYSQMIAEECFFLANFRAGCSIDRLEYNGKEIALERKRVGAKTFSLRDLQKNSQLAAKNIIAKMFDAAVPALGLVLSQFGFQMPSEKALEVVKVVGKNWEHKQKRKDRTEDLHEVFLTEVFFALFAINDVDNSSSMDVDEFMSTLESLGLAGCDPLTAKRLMDEHDKDKSGSIDGSEFAMIMVHEFCRSDQPRGVIVEKSTGKPWPTPTTGLATLDVKFIIDSASVFDVGSEDGIDTLIQGMQNARTSEQKDVLFQQACTSPYFFFTADQAQALLDAALNSGLTMLPLDMIIAILPQIVNEEETNRFLDQNLNDQGKFALRVKMGPLYNAFVGLPTGHYFVDLHKTLDRMGSKRLAAVSVNEARIARTAGANLSQKGNGTNFRNEVMGQNYYTSVPTPVSGQWFADCPRSGELRFDYVSTKRVLVGTLPLSKSRFKKFVDRIQFSKILELKPLAEEFQAEINLAQEVLNHAQQHAASLKSRSDSLESMREVMKIHGLKQNLKAVSERVLNEPCLKVVSPLSYGEIKEQFNEFMDTSHHYLDILPQERQRDVSRMNYNPDPNFRPPTPDVLFRGEPPDRRKMSPIYPYAYRKLLELQIQMPIIYLTTEQVVELMNFFPEEGYLRIQALMSVFSHITDVENICLIYDNHCSLNERHEMLHRLGVLCVMDPMKPDREYCLDLRHYDQREWCKLLILLALNEPGDNWIDGGEYRWSRYDDPVPGWILPQPWTLPDEADGGEGGPRKYGWLRVTYTSTARGCEPAPQVRRNLRRRTLSGLKTLV